MCRILQNEGHTCEEADRGAKALEIARSMPDLMVLDVRLPDMSGYDVCRALKSDAVTSSIMVLQMSASFVANEDRVGHSIRGQTHTSPTRLIAWS